MAIGDKNLTGKASFWLNIAAEEVYNSFQSRREAIDRLQKTIGWVFGLYTTISFASLMFGSKKEISNVILILFAAAFFFLIVAYWLSMLSSFTRIKNYYSSAQVSIQESFINAVNRTTWLFSTAVIFSGVGTLLYTAALCGQFSSSVWLHGEKATIKDNEDIGVSCLYRKQKVIQ